MKTINNQLMERYKNILGTTGMMTPFGENGLSMPLLISFSDEAAVESADLRIMFFGQETREWTDTGTVEDIMERYRHDFNDFSGLPGSGAFWEVLSEMKNVIESRLPDKRICYIWNNIVKADYSPDSDYRTYKVPDEVYAAFRDKNRDFILCEIEIIKPDLLLFFTGAQSSGYDEKIDDVFYHNTDRPTEKEPILIDGNKNALAIAHLEIENRNYDAYISYHPRALKTNRNLKNFILNAIADQCIKVCREK